MLEDPDSSVVIELIGVCNCLVLPGLNTVIARLDDVDRSTSLSDVSKTVGREVISELEVTRLLAPSVRFKIVGRRREETEPRVEWGTDMTGFVAGVVIERVVLGATKTREMIGCWITEAKKEGKKTS